MIDREPYQNQTLASMQTETRAEQLEGMNAFTMANTEVHYIDPTLSVAPDPEWAPRTVELTETIAPKQLQAMDGNTNSNSYDEYAPTIAQNHVEYDDILALPVSPTVADSTDDYGFNGMISLNDGIDGNFGI
jgi:hypothetical protein